MNIVDTSVRNCMDSVIGLNGVSIPARQSRMVRGLDLDDERVRARVEAGDIEIAGYDSYATVAEADEYHKRGNSGWNDATDEERDEALEGAEKLADSVPDTARHRLFGG